MSTDAQFSQKAADVVGLYLGPPDNAVVLSVDEKPCIQALERAQGWLRMPDGRSLTGFTHEYKRHGTTTLFAALNIDTKSMLATTSANAASISLISWINWWCSTPAKNSMSCSTT